MKPYRMMDIEEREACKAAEAERFLPEITRMRKSGYENPFIVACLEHLYVEDMLCEVTDIITKAGFSDDDIQIGRRMYFDNFDAGANPLMAMACSRIKSQIYH